MDGGANLLDRDLDAVNTVDIPAVNQGYGILDGHSVSQALKTSKMTLPRIYIGENTATKVSVSWNVDFAKIKSVFLTYVCNDSSDRIVLSGYDASSITLRGSIKQYIGASLTVLHE